MMVGCPDCGGRLVEEDFGDPATDDTDIRLYCRMCTWEGPLVEPQGDDPRPLTLSPADMP